MRWLYVAYGPRGAGIIVYVTFRVDKISLVIRSFITYLSEAIAASNSTATYLFYLFAALSLFYQALYSGLLC